MSGSAIGASVRRRDSADKLRGRTRFAIDRGGAATLHCALLRAEVAAGIIRRVDTAPALAVPGVHAVVTGADAPGRYGVGIADQPLFASDVVRYHGEPIAAVAADTLDIARRAAQLIVVEIEPLDPHLSMAAALEPGAREIHPDWASYEELTAQGARGGNIAWEATVVRGDAEGAFAREDATIVETTFAVGRQNQLSLEPRVALARFEDGRYVIETSTQYPWAVRAGVARLLGIPAGQVRVTVPPVGGGFGQKYQVSIEPYVALLARATGREVKLALSRQEEQLTALSREPAEIRIRSAVTAEGEIAAREAVVLMDCGAYGGEQCFLTTMTAHTLTGNYRLGAVRLVSRAVYTNTPPTGAFRCCNGVYATAALERHTDDICARLDLDRWDFRRRNVLGDGDLGATGQVFEGDVLGPMLDRMQALRAERPTTFPSDGRLCGTGVAVGTWFVYVGPSAATVNLNPDGSATLVTAGVEIGSGSLVQALPQIVAERLGLRHEDVIVKAADTDAAGFDMGVGGGRTTVSLGAASVSASDEARQILLDAASEMLEAAPGDLVLADRGAMVAGDPTSRVALTEVIAHAMKTRGPVTGSGAFTAPGTGAMPGCAAGHMLEAIDVPVFAVHECDVAVDPATGHVEILAYRVVQDVGRAINPRAIAGQIQGGVVQGLGYALHEESTVGPDGRILQDTLERYRVPLAGDVVDVDQDLFEGAPSIGPFGAKGAGEVPILCVGGAVANAVTDATGKATGQLPLTPPRVLGILRGLESPPALGHIAQAWRDNLLTDADVLLAAASG